MDDPTQYSVKKLAPIGEAQGAAPVGTDDATTKGTLIEEGLDDKVYMIKSSGTIVDVSKIRRLADEKVLVWKEMNYSKMSDKAKK